VDTIRDLRAEILQNADRLFYAHGIHAVGINKLIEESGVAKDTFYRYFGSKEALIIAYLEARYEASARNFETSAGAVNDAGKRLRAIFDNLVRRLQREGYRGCAFMMALAEYGHVPTIAHVIRIHKERTRSSIEQTCLEIDPQSRKVARQLSLLYEGFIARWSVSREPDDQIALLEAVDEAIASLSSPRASTSAQP
jgi:AcrR family transcriptional regulator